MLQISYRRFSPVFVVLVFSVLVVATGYVAVKMNTADEWTDTIAVNTAPIVANTAEGKIYKTDDAIAPTTDAEYKEAIAAIWLAYRTNGGTVDFAGVAIEERQHQLALITALYADMVPLTVPAAYRELHLVLVMVSTFWESAILLYGEDAESALAAEKAHLAQIKLDEALTRYVWLENDLQ